MPIIQPARPPARRRAGRRAVARRATVVAAAAAVVIGALAAPAAAATLRELGTAAGKDVGFALDPGRLSETQYRQIADAEFSLVVAENAMKWDATEATRGQFTFGQGDQVASYAAAGGKKLYGHTLVWHSQLPGWVAGLSASDMQSAMVNHVTQVAKHFAGKTFAWDVVNEAFAENGARRAESPFQQKLGDGYIETAFRAARAADPSARLCYNDYNIEGVNAKSDAVYAMVRDFKARGVPIDCVGLQSHFIVGQVPSSLQTNMNRFAALGVDVRVTELDIRMSTPSDQAKLTQQAADYRKVFEVCNAVARCQGVTIWGITDTYSWVPNTFPGQGAALVWDDSYRAKPAYAAIQAAFGGVTPTPTPTTPQPTPTTPQPTPTTPSPTTPPPAGACQVTWTANGWNTGFTANVTVKNTSSTAISGWTLRFAFPSGQTVTQAWSSTVTQSGAQVTVTNAPWNGSIAPGASQVFGFNGAHSGTNAAPTAFTLNGAACTTA
ncbi:endo-1,4-beta-xylanase [Cellulomonas sp. DKR-3]|uniref:Beta-xylanase n=1 Tax=Cellulomonas fulva TaxID=2835530 RepID=A0ABS5TZH5_9CELL|nr:endo-1,4-beta-xylanase [Cellulomonas fulva]MBT0994552.1 endo-1,4-beta-xylanase [Cellulomonas fulva]